MSYRKSGQRIFSHHNQDQRFKQGLAGHYIGFGGGKTVPDLSGNHKHATIVGAPQRVLTKDGQRSCWRFDGSADYITTPQPWSDAPTQYFLSLWVYDTAGGEGIAYNWRRSVNNAVWFEIQGQYGTWRCFAGDGSNPLVTVTAGTQTTNVWTHLLMVRDGNTVTFYKDGVQTGTTTGTIGTITMAGGEYPVIGAQSNDFIRKWTGMIADVRLYKRLPTDADIKILSSPTFRPIRRFNRRHTVEPIAASTTAKSYGYIFG